MLKGALLENYSLARHTSWRIGGQADRVYFPADKEDLIAFVAALPSDEPLTWMGLGSNLLIRDGGVRGTVIITQGKLKRLNYLGNGLIEAEAGVSCPSVARFAARNHLGYCEFLAGIPGTVGGALAMNAGAFGGETWQAVKCVEVLLRSGQVVTRTPHEYQISYRQVKTPATEYFLAAEFIFPPGNKEETLTNIHSLLEKRAATQPTGLWSCGSVFRNPPEDFAARLIEACGLKGKTLGGACVSEKHANFILNHHNATANDVESLINYVRETVERKHGVLLQPEVHIIGERG